MANIQTFLAENNTDVGDSGTQDAEHGIVVEVMNQAKIAGINRVSVLVKDD